MEETGSTASEVASSDSAYTNPRWLAPECLAGQKATLASDVFSFGVVLWELLTWEMPWAGVYNPWEVGIAAM
jgi:serine/threonine protein kinase